MLNIIKNIKFTIIIFLNIGIIECYGQDTHYSNLNENLNLINPSAITSIDMPLLQLTYRNQWPGSASFVTYSGAFYYNLPTLKSAAGIQFIRDDQGKGIMSTTGIDLVYGYRTNIFSNNISLAAGLSGGYNFFAVNLSKLHFENNQIPAVNDRSEYADFSAGFELGIMNQTFFGSSITHLTAPTISSGNKIFRKYCVSLRGNYDLSKPYQHQKLSLEPLLITTLQENFVEILYGGRVNYSTVYGGAYLRQNNKFNIDAIIFLLGISFGNNELFYSYDLNLSGADASFNKLASHEVTFLHKFEYTKNRNKKGAIKCPKF